MSNHASPVNPIPAVTIVVRHSAACPHFDDSFYKRCRCRKSLRYYVHGKPKRVSAKTRTWSVAEEAKRELEEKFRTSAGSSNVTLQSEVRTDIQRAIELFLISKRTQGTGEDTMNKLTRELERFRLFMAKRNVYFPSEIRLEELTEFRSTWNALYPSSGTRSMVQGRLRSFLRYCYQARLVDRIPHLSPIKVDERPTMPLTDEQYTSLLATTDEFDPERRTRVHAFIQTMRHSGLAIQDAATLPPTALIYDPSKKIHRIETSRQKTGVHVSVPIPPEVVKEIQAAAKLNLNKEYIFWNRQGGKPISAVNAWEEIFREIFPKAGMPGGHSHQLRDTFAVSLLVKGVPLEEVSKLLGHESIKTTEKSYAKWVKARQDRLDQLVIDTWEKAA